MKVAFTALSMVAIAICHGQLADRCFGPSHYKAIRANSVYATPAPHPMGFPFKEGSFCPAFSVSTRK